MFAVVNGLFQNLSPFSAAMSRRFFFECYDKIKLNFQEYPIFGFNLELHVFQFCVG